jgi:hypothetical protein
MTLPGFLAEASLDRTLSLRLSPRRSTAPGVVVPQLRTGRGGLGFGGLSFTCGGWGCVCSGDDDCNDMFSSNVCGPWGICIDNYCYCSR